MSKITIYSPPATAQIKACAVDFDLRRAPVPVHLVQYDKTIPILAVSLYKGGSPYTLPADAEVNVRMNKRNNLCVYNPALGCNESRDMVYVAVTPQMTTQDGTFEPILEVVINSGVAGTSPMQLVIRRNPVQEDAIEDTSEAKTLTELVSQAAASATAAAQSAGAAAEDAGKAAASATAAAESDEHAAATAQNIKDSLDQIASNAAAVSQLKEDTAKLKDGKISKFYASSQGNTNLPDSDDGRIMDLMLYGKSSQDGTPTPDAPVEIKSVVNPVIKVMGKNLFSCDNYQKLAYTSNDGAKNVAATAKQLSFTSDASAGHCGIYISGVNLQGYIQGYNAQTKYFISIKVKSSVSCKVMFGVDSITTTEIPAGETTLKISTLITKNFVVLYVANAESNITISDILISVSETDYEPYTETSAKLPYTLNAIPVSSGGNITVDGQQYIADYVDIERGKLVRCVERKKLFDLNVQRWGSLTETRADFQVDIEKYDSGTYKYRSIPCIMSSLTNGASGYPSFDYSTTDDSGWSGYAKLGIYVSKDYDTVDKLKSYLGEDTEILYQSKDPTETDLTADEIAAFKALVSHYPVTNVSVTSDQLDGYTVFDYPISLANGWNYVKQQLGDTRDYLYGIDLMTAEAYVNSEYAAALAEIEV